MSDYLCDHCGGPTVYQTFSGGKEYYCPGCGNQASYDMEKEGLPRATLLQSDEGLVALKAQMDQRLAEIRDGYGDQEYEDFMGEPDGER
jgi:uncharacterized Zn finger protein (UPF0148 family)